MEPKILIVCDRPATADSMVHLLSEGGPRTPEIQCASSSVEATALVRAEPFDLIIVNVPLENGLGDKAVRTLSALTWASLILLVPREIRERMEEKVRELGVLVLEKPLHKEEFRNAVELALLFSRRNRTLYEENARLRERIRELKIVDRAKVLLVEYLKLSEDQAHRYIEQQSMELRKSRAEVAQGIINTYEFGIL
ncbi:MAG: ANTAR domain-containing protein [Clostridia bacterium]|nr:ANTAR domain-containing protein [Clostridia bacterium]